MKHTTLNTIFSIFFLTIAFLGSVDIGRRLKRKSLVMQDFRKLPTRKRVLNSLLAIFVTIGISAVSFDSMNYFFPELDLLTLPIGMAMGVLFGLNVLLEGLGFGSHNKSRR